MSKAILGYWNLRGLGEPIRYLLRYVGQDFVDKRYQMGPGPEYNRDEWLKDKHSLGLMAPDLPYYIDGDLKITKSVAILRHLARKHGLTGKSEDEQVKLEILEQTLFDMRLALRGVVTDFTNHKQSRQVYVENLPGTLNILDNFLSSNQFVGGDRITYVDFMLYEMLDVHQLFHPPLLQNHPRLKDFLKRIEELPSMKQHITSPTYTKRECFHPKFLFYDN